MKEIIVTSLAFYEGSRHRVGEILQVPEDLSGSWFEEVKQAAQRTQDASRAPRKAKITETDDLV